MNSISILNGHLILPQAERLTSLHLQDGKIADLGNSTLRDGPVIDAADCYVTPGLIDLQVNGSAECDFWQTPDAASLTRLSERMLRSGVTTILPTIITAPIEHMASNRDLLKSLGLAALEPAEHMVRMPGVHFEGPCLSPLKPGVHPPEHVKPLSPAVLKNLIDSSVRLITVAPETDTADTCLAWLKDQGVTVAVGHSNATFAEAERAFNQGASLLTHTFNALPALHHRQPGAVACALLRDDVTCCFIADGLHVDPEMLRLAYKLKGFARSILVTDIAAIGTSTGGLVGSSVVLDQCVRNMVSWKIASFPEAIYMATSNPAKAIGLEHRLGQIQPGYDADLVLWNKQDLAVKKVILAGRVVYSA